MQNKFINLKSSILISGLLFMVVNANGQKTEDIRNEQKQSKSEIQSESRFAPGLRKNNNQSTIHGKINTSSSDQKITIEQASNPVNSGVGSRKCAPKISENPFGISRKNFLKLPPDRQQFLLENSHRYIIVD